MTGQVGKQKIPDIIYEELQSMSDFISYLLLTK